MKKALLITLFLTLIVSLSILEWRPWHSVAQTDIPISHETATTKTIPITIKANNAEYEVIPQQQSSPIIRAQLSPLNYTTIAAEIGAKIQSLGFREGESFKKGQTLVVFECSIQSAQLDKAGASMNIAERTFTTNRKLLALGSVSRLETENAESELQKAKAEVAELSAVVRKCKIIAPFAGKIVEQRVRTEQFVQPGQVLLEILDQSALEIEFVAPSKWSRWIKIGDLLKIKIDETDKDYPARITRIGAKIDPVSQTMKIAAVIDGDFEELSPGMSGSIQIDPNLKNQ